MKTPLLLLNYRNPIDVIFQKDDQEKADVYISNNSCLLATALHRMGYPYVVVGVDHVEIINYDCKMICYRIPAREASQLMWRVSNSNFPPYYSREVIGMQIQLEPVMPLI